MANNDNAQARRLLESMTAHGEQAWAEEFSKNYPLSKSANAVKKAEWAKHVCSFLEEHYEDETVKAIRMDCACGPSKRFAEKLKKVYDTEKDPAAFAEKINQLKLGLSLEYDGNDFFLIYPVCYCSCVNKNEETLPKAWCYCTLGYTKRMFEIIFGKEVQAELISSVKTGDPECRIRIMAL